MNWVRSKLIIDMLGWIDIHKKHICSIVKHTADFIDKLYLLVRQILLHVRICAAVVMS
jgi:hypothetical protein